MSPEAATPSSMPSTMTSTPHVWHNKAPTNPGHAGAYFQEQAKLMGPLKIWDVTRSASSGGSFTSRFSGLGATRFSPRRGDLLRI